MPKVEHIVTYFHPTWNAKYVTVNANYLMENMIEWRKIVLNCDILNTQVILWTKIWPSKRLAVSRPQDFFHRCIKTNWTGSIACCQCFCTPSFFQCGHYGNASPANAFVSWRPLLFLCRGRWLERFRVNDSTSHPRVLSKRNHVEMGKILPQKILVFHFVWNVFCVK